MNGGIRVIKILLINKHKERFVSKNGILTLV